MVHISMQFFGGRGSSGRAAGGGGGASAVVYNTFNTENEAMEYIDKYDWNEYTHCYSDNEYPIIEIEEHNEDGSLLNVITID